MAAQIARYSNTPVTRSTETITIMPSNRKMTFQSIAVDSSKKACSASVIPRASISAAPAMAAAVRCTHSVAMKT